MILVAVGNATQGFRRLLDSVEQMANNGLFEGEAVVIQSGNNHDFRSSNCKQVAFLTMEEFVRTVNEASLVICHGGAGTLYHAFRASKVPVVMPRRRKYGEHVDDQLELVRVLAGEGRIIPAYEPIDLPQAIAAARSRIVQSAVPHIPRMLKLVERAIHELTMPNSS